MNWEMTAPETDDFEGYLERDDVKEIVSRLPSAPMVVIPKAEPQNNYVFHYI